jgi:hypothetical protein
MGEQLKNGMVARPDYSVQLLERDELCHDGRILILIAHPGNQF